MSIKQCILCFLFFGNIETNPGNFGQQIDETDPGLFSSFGTTNQSDKGSQMILYFYFGNKSMQNKLTASRLDTILPPNHLPLNTTSLKIRTKMGYGYDKYLKYLINI